MNAIEVPVGSRIRLYGQELLVTRKDHPFLGRDNMVLLVESTDERWHSSGGIALVGPRYFGYDTDPVRFDARTLTELARSPLDTAS